MSVYRPKKSPYYQYDFWHQNRRFCGSTGATTKQEAKKVEKERKTQALIETTKCNPSLPMTLEVATSRYWEEVGQFHAQAKTTVRNLKRLEDFFGKTTKLSTITDDDVSRLVVWRRSQCSRDREGGKPISNTTVNRSTIEPLQKIFNRAINIWGQKSFLNPPNWKQHLLKEPNERVREVLQSEECKLDAIPEDYRPVVDFARASGLRMASCLLRKDEVDLLDGRIYTIGKGGKRIILPITIEMRAILMAQMANPTRYVFTYRAKRARRGDENVHARGERIPITIAGLKTIWKRSRDRGLPADLRFHDLRHDFATKMLRETRNIKLVSRALHHSSLETTSRYAHVFDDEVLAGMEAASLSRQRRAVNSSPDQSPEKLPAKEVDD